MALGGEWWCFTTSTFFSTLDFDLDLEVTLDTLDALGLASTFYSGYFTNDLDAALLCLYSTSLTLVDLGYALVFACSFYFERDFCSTWGTDETLWAAAFCGATLAGECL